MRVATQLPSQQSRSQRILLSQHLNTVDCRVDGCQYTTLKCKVKFETGVSIIYAILCFTVSNIHFEM